MIERLPERAQIALETIATSSRLVLGAVVITAAGAAVGGGVELLLESDNNSPTLPNGDRNPNFTLDDVGAREDFELPITGFVIGGGFALGVAALDRYVDL